MMSIPLLIIFLYGFCNIRTADPEQKKQAQTAIAYPNDGSWLAKGWISGIVVLMLILSITGL